jgi:hypothetical protein
MTPGRALYGAAMNLGVWIAIGIGLGMAIGAAIENIGIGVAIGIALGTAMGGAVHWWNTKRGR